LGGGKLCWCVIERQKTGVRGAVDKLFMGRGASLLPRKMPEKWEAKDVVQDPSERKAG